MVLIDTLASMPNIQLHGEFWGSHSIEVANSSGYSSTALLAGIVEVTNLVSRHAIPAPLFISLYIHALVVGAFDIRSVGGKSGSAALAV